MTELRWHPQAIREAKVIRHWYRVEQDVPDVAQRFQQALQVAVEQVVEAPRRWPLLVRDARKRPLHGFPFRVVYQQNADHVLILAVMHERQQPEYWRSRTP